MADSRIGIVRSINSNMTGKRMNVKLLWAVLCLALLTGCGNKVEENGATDTKESIEVQPEATPEVTPEPTVMLLILTPRFCQGAGFSSL